MLARVTFMAVALTAQGAWAQVHGGDVILRAQGGVVQTGRIDGGAAVFPERVFDGAFGDGGVPNATLEPGYDSEEGAFSPLVPVGITIRKALRMWDGQSFDSIPTERLDVSKGLTTITTPATDPPPCQVGGSLTLGLASASGRLHQHAAYVLGAPAADGVYLLELEAWMGVPGGGASAPFWIVLNQNQPAVLVEPAIEYVEHILTCPADFNRDGLLNIADFGAFQTAFALGDPRADFNRDCLLNLADFGAFQTAFALACP